MAGQPDFHDSIWRQRIAQGEKLNPSNASAWKLVQYTQNVASILDVGCGTGLFLQQFSNVKKTGIDFSPVAIKEASKKNIDTRLVDINEALPYNKNTFDLVCSIQVLQHVNDVSFCVSELSRVSRKYVLINIPNHAYWHFTIDQLKGKTPLVLQTETGHKNKFTLSRMEKIIRESNLDIIARDNTGGNWKNVYPPLTATGASYLCTKRIEK